MAGKAYAVILNAINCAVTVVPIPGKTAQAGAERVTGQMRHLDPIQNQKARVVANQPQIALAYRDRPIDPAVTSLRLPGGRAKQEATQNAVIASQDQILHILPDRASIAQIVVFL